MTVRFRSGGGWVQPATIRKRVSGAWQTVGRVYARVSGAWVLVWSSFSAVKTADANGEVFAPEPSPGTASVGASGGISVSGGSGSYSFSWSFLSGDSGIAQGVGGATPSWSAVVTKNSHRTAVWRCIVSDGVSSVVIDMGIDLYYYNDA